MQKLVLCTAVCCFAVLNVVTAADLYDVDVPGAGLVHEGSSWPCF